MYAIRSYYELISNLAEKYVRDMYNNSKMDAVVGIGGGGGTSIITQVMRGLPIGIPKIIVITSYSIHYTKLYDPDDFSR